MEEKIYYPLVTIGMPVFNESCFIENSLKSILNQDYPNLKIIISDNASTDDTYAKCMALASTDSRVSIHKFETNQGAGSNFMHVFDNAAEEARYFMWAAGHDLWAQNYISECVFALESHPAASIAFGSSDWIDENGEFFGRECGWTDTRGLRPVARFFTVIWGNMHPVLGLIRLAHLKKFQFATTYAGHDLVILSKLSLLGDFIHATSTSWSRREFRGQESHNNKIKRYRSAEYKLSNSILNKWFPLLKLPIELIKTITNSSLSFPEKTLSIIALIGLMPVRYLNGKKQ